MKKRAPINKKKINQDYPRRKINSSYMSFTEVLT